MPIHRRGLLFITLFAMTWGLSTTVLAQDNEQGSTLFQQQCSGCHSVQPDVHLAGPSLAGVLGREAGASPNFNYSTALEEANTVWDEDTLDAFLAAPAEYLPGTTKVVAVPDEQQRKDIITYLQTLTDQP